MYVCFLLNEYENGVEEFVKFEIENVVCRLVCLRVLVMNYIFFCLIFIFFIVLV